VRSAFGVEFSVMGVEILGMGGSNFSAGKKKNYDLTEKKKKLSRARPFFLKKKKKKKKMCSSSSSSSSASSATLSPPQPPSSSSLSGSGSTGGDSGSTGADFVKSDADESQKKKDKRSRKVQKLTVLAIVIILLGVLIAQSAMLLRIDKRGEENCAATWSADREECYAAIAEIIRESPPVQTRIWESFFPFATFSSTIVDVCFEFGEARTAVIAVARRSFWLAKVLDSRWARAIISVASVGALPLGKSSIAIDMSAAASACGYIEGVKAFRDIGCMQWALAKAAVDMPLLARPGVLADHMPGAAAIRGDHDKVWARTSSGFREVRSDTLQIWSAVAIAAVLLVAIVMGMRVYALDGIERLKTYAPDEHTGLTKEFLASPRYKKPHRRRVNRFLYNITPGESGNRTSVVVTLLAFFVVFYLPRGITGTIEAGDEDDAGKFGPPILAALLPFAVPAGFSLYARHNTRRISRKDKRNSVMASVFLGSAAAFLALTAQLVFAGLLFDFPNALNPAARLGLTVSYFVVINSTKTICGRILPDQLDPAHQVIRALRYKLRTRKDVIDARFVVLDVNFAHIYSADGLHRVGKSAARIESLIFEQPRVWVMMVEPCLWLLFLAAINTAGDNAEMFDSGVWAPVLTVGALSVRVWPRLGDVLKRSAKRERMENTVERVRLELARMMRRDNAAQETTSNDEEDLFPDRVIDAVLNEGFYVDEDCEKYLIRSATPKDKEIIEFLLSGAREDVEQW
jgi:hypothetical protein